MPILLVAVLLALCVVGCAWRRPRPVGALVMRAGSVTVLGLVVVSPSVVVEDAGVGEPARVAVLVDRSPSMDVLAPGVDALWLGDELDVLRAHATVVEVDHTGGVPSGVEGESKETSPLLGTVNALLEGGVLDHLVLVTDGIDTTGGSLAGVDPGGTRVHALALGGVEPPPDARVIAAPATPLAYNGQPASLVVRVQHSGLEGRVSRLSVEHLGEVVREREVRLESGVTELRVPVTPRLPDGVTQSALAYTARLDTLAGEADGENNASTALLSVSAEPIRVLVLEGQPHWDTRFFVRALRADGQIELTSASTLDDRFRSRTRSPRVRITRSGGVSDERGVTLPASVDDIAAYDVVAIGRGIEQFYPGRDARRLVDAVLDRGVSVMFFRGDPVVSDAPEALRTMREFGALLDAPVERELGEGSVRRAGVGVVMTTGSESGYRDALLPPSSSVEERSAYARSWSRVVRTLATGSGMAPGARVQLSVSPTSAPPGATRTIRARARGVGDALPEEVTVVSASGEERRIALAPDPGAALVRAASFTPGEEGVWCVTDGGGLETRFVVIEDRVERTMLAERTGETVSLAERTGGLTLSMGDGPGAIAPTIAP
ncbi:MAG: hypothetical protein AAGH64_06620, partial [Planctomycetota bacterium]